MQLLGGILQGARQVASPNCDARPENTEICLIVIHNISLPPGQFGGSGVFELFTNRIDPDSHPFYREIKDLKVSSHFFVRRGGEIVQFVPTHLRAWHAGASAWRGRERCNDFSIGIELEGSDDTEFSEPQYQAACALIGALRNAYPILDIVGHSEIAPGRKTDPGPCFDWAKLFEMLKFHRQQID